MHLNGVYDRSGGASFNGAPVYINSLGGRQAHILCSVRSDGRWGIITRIKYTATRRASDECTLICADSADVPWDSRLLWEIYDGNKWCLDPMITCCTDMAANPSSASSSLANPPKLPDKLATKATRQGCLCRAQRIKREFHGRL